MDDNEKRFSEVKSPIAVPCVDPMEQVEKPEAYCRSLINRNDKLDADLTAANAEIARLGKQSSISLSPPRTIPHIKIKPLKAKPEEKELQVAIKSESLDDSDLKDALDDLGTVLDRAEANLEVGLDKTIAEAKQHAKDMGYSDDSDDEMEAGIAI
ncbi:hypothetical protein DPSP01_006496 [Paraphaeosphaeria sporulosa]|uniref:Uncharacterized protein n=1 Tax=Paraphaeosphaeria sporulosa TaxID=1460663 RepID=A0A177CPA9_9PLEO|nr:uncharacterized protein CC84DRAFT_1257449 [Paraphaeosphaeria sporulosa]OAG08617.1 hypothetical protein CC84DRAFT_1257449 [Paraphaeosphaeria sporulosa]